MTILNNDADVRRIREAGAIVRELLNILGEKAKAGVSTAALDAFSEDFILRNGGEPAFKGYKGYPSTICASVNEVVVHGIPSEDKVLEDGDIISVDVGVKKNGYYADAARTFPVGNISDEAQRLVRVTEECLREAVNEAVAGNRLYDVSNAVQKIAEREGFEEVRAFVGHGIGVRLHEPPEVPNWGQKGKGQVLEEGLLLAIEPMINQGKREVEILEDGWTAVTADRKLSAHFENTVMVGINKTEILT
ncbi:MAG: type I methionyl aminopeptidase [Candidatus Omnitrophica bacterium]|nr:type I methionyl aminopeptidase [Candidatus Omnitrophota bacterium]